MASPATLFEVSPDAYGKQVFTVGFDSNDNTSTLDLNSTSNKSFGDNFGFQLSNKATLKKLGYKAGEIYWRGTAGYNFGISNNLNTIKAEIGTGVSFDLNFLYVNFDISGNYLNRSSGSSSSGSTKISQNVTGYSGSIGAGIPLGKIDIGAFYEYGNVNDYINATEKASFTRSGYKFPLTYRNYKDISTSLIFASSVDTYNDTASSNKIKNTNNSAIISFSWLYNN